MKNKELKDLVKNLTNELKDLKVRAEKNSRNIVFIGIKKIDSLISKVETIDNELEGKLFKTKKTKSKQIQVLQTVQTNQIFQKEATIEKLVGRTEEFLEKFARQFSNYEIPIGTKLLFRKFLNDTPIRDVYPKKYKITINDKYKYNGPLGKCGFNKITIFKNHSKHRLVGYPELVSTYLHELAHLVIQNISRYEVKAIVSGHSFGWKLIFDRMLRVFDPNNSLKRILPNISNYRSYS